jgi:hypothetical protein
LIDRPEGQVGINVIFGFIKVFNLEEKFGVLARPQAMENAWHLSLKVLECGSTNLRQVQKARVFIRRIFKHVP